MVTTAKNNSASLLCHFDENIFNAHCDAYLSKLLSNASPSCHIAIR